MQAACLMFCFEERLCDVRGSDDRVTLAALPPELVELIVRHCVLGSAVVRFTHPEELECSATLQEEDQIWALESFTSADGVQFLASGGDACEVNLWDLSSRECVATLEGHTERISCLTSFSDANGAPSLASGSIDHTIILWDVVAHTQVVRLSGHTEWVTALTVYRNAAGLPCLASGSTDSSIKLWDSRTHTAIATLNHRYARLCVFSDAHGADFLASGGLDSLIKVWDLATHENLFTLHGHTLLVRSLTCFSIEDGVPMLVSASDDRTLRVWNLESRVAVTTFDCDSHLRSLGCVAGPDGRVMLAYTSGHGRTGTIVDLSTGWPVFEMKLASAYALDTFVDHASGVPCFAVAGCIERDRPDVIELYTGPV
jgi:WD40 repeat protein